MANVPAGTSHVIVSGAMPGAERWACGFWLNTGEGGDAQDQADVFAASSSNFQDMLDVIMGMNVPQVTANQVDVYEYSGGSGASDHGVATFNKTGTVANGARHPNQIALVTTLRSAVVSGRGRGRIYWPATAMPVDNNGVAGSLVDTVVGAVGGFLIPSGGVVVSRTGGTKAPITRVDADHVLDTLNARRRQLPSVRTVYPSS